MIHCPGTIKVELKMGFKQLIRNLRLNTCIACGKFMPHYAVEHKTFGNMTVPCHKDCNPTEEQLYDYK